MMLVIVLLIVNANGIGMIGQNACVVSVVVLNANQLEKHL